MIAKYLAHWRSTKKMLEQVYKLDLPPFEVIHRPTHEFDNSKRTTYFYGTNVSDVVDLEKLKPFLRGIELDFTHYLYFRKFDSESHLHIDHMYSDGSLKHCIWAINWIFDGLGTIEYWHFDRVTVKGHSGGANNLSYGKVPIFQTNHPSDYKYIMNNNSAYLVNATLPHRARGHGDRKAFSLRIEKSTEHYWPDIVEKFRPLIIT